MELYPFQQELVDKFAACSRTYPHVLIGDDMGLGKTVEAIALDRSRRNTQLSPLQANWIKNHRRMTLVVTKKSVMASWAEHFNKWQPGLVVMSLVEESRTGVEVACQNQEVDVVIVNWESLRLMPTLCQVPWLHVIGDEIQAIKNRKAQVTLHYKKIQALFKTDMSGTWADNKPEDAWSILNHLYPKKWRSYWAFFNHHIIVQSKINHKTGNTYRETIGVAFEDELQEQMAPFYIRRLKEVVAPDLPEKVYDTVRVRLHPQQQRAYDAMRRDMLAWVGQNEDQPIAAPVVIAKLIRLQQLAIAFGEIRDVEKMSWKDVSEEVAKRLEAKGREVKHVKPDDPYVNPEGKWQARLQEIQRKLFLTDPSSKLDAVQEWLEQIPTSEPAVVFGTSKLAINLLSARLGKAGESYGVLTGDVTSDVARRDLMERFQAGKFRVFLGTIKAGGVGITLTRASRMGFIDRDWSPSANRQAEDRIHRIGQTATCFYTDFIAERTIDEERLRDIAMKWEWLKQVLGDK